MSFLDDLKNVHEEEAKKQQAESDQEEKDWAAFVELWHNSIKDECMAAAKKNEHRINIYFKSFFEILQYHAINYCNYCNYCSGDLSVEDCKIVERIELKIGHWKDNDFRCGGFTIAMSSYVANRLKKDIIKLLETDGLTVKYPKLWWYDARRYDDISFTVKW